MSSMSPVMPTFQLRPWRNTRPRSKLMIILGIDPGTITMGYGVIEVKQDDISLVCCDSLSSPSRSPMGQRLAFLYDNLSEIISRYQPDAVAIEQPFVAKNARSALVIGKAQAVAILAAAKQGIPAYEYTPTQVKQRVTSYGASSKEQVKEMVRLQLGLAEAPSSSDAADALAVAICHSREIHFKDLLAEQG